MDADRTGASAPQRKGHLVVWLGLATKIFQSGKALKVVLAGVAVSGWTVLYSLPFALALTATLVFHEWGHLRAMRRFGIPTKGMYLIPFVGGIAVGEQARDPLGGRLHLDDGTGLRARDDHRVLPAVPRHVESPGGAGRLGERARQRLQPPADPSPRRRARRQGARVLGAQPLGVPRAHGGSRGLPRRSR